MYELGEQFQVPGKNTKVNPEQIITGNKYRITVLTERLVRLEYSEEGKFEDRLTELVMNRNFSVPEFNIKQDEQFLEITTSYFHLLYKKEKKFNNGLFAPGETLKITLNNTDKEWYYGHPEVRNLGGNFDGFDKKKNKDEKSLGLYSLDGFVSLDDSDSLVLEPSGVFVNKDNKSIDIYVLMYRKDWQDCLKDYFNLTGKPVLIPRYALGNWWSKNFDYTGLDVDKLFTKFRKNEIPIALMLFDKNWHIRNTDKLKNIETGFTFNETLLGNSKQLIQNLHQRKVRVGLKINPNSGIASHEEFYNKAAEYLETKEDPIPINTMNPKFWDVYFKTLIHPLEAKGVDMFWIENGSKSNSLDSFLFNHYHLADLNRLEARRALILGRSSKIAPHRYSVLYSGETKVSWDTLKKIPIINTNAAHMGVSFWSHDVGGYTTGVEENELYLRWVQLATFSPILRFHVDYGKYYKREPWRYDVQTFEIVKDYLNLRHRLIPYLYTESYKYYKLGTPIIQPLYYKTPEMIDQPQYNNEYYFGSELLVSALTDKKHPVMNRVVHRFFLPKGTWYDFKTGKKFPGDRKYVAYYKDEDYPVFARDGSIIPLANPSDINDTSAPSNLEVHIFPGRSNTYNLYEDDGVTNLYKQGFYLLTQIDYNYIESNYTVIIRAVEGKSGIIPNKRNYKIRFRNTKQAEDVIVYFNDQKIPLVSYTDDTDFIVELKDIPTIGQLSINCKGKDIEIDASRLMNDEIDNIISDLPIETILKNDLAEIFFSELSIKKKRIGVRKLARKGLEKKFVDLFIKLLEHIEQI